MLRHVHLTKVRILFAQQIIIYLILMKREFQKIEVIIPVLNEEKNISKVLYDIPDYVHRIIVVDNGSRDNTIEVARKNGAFVVEQKKRGYGNACLKGMEYIQPDTDIVVFIDGDYSDYPEELNKLVKPIYNENYDFVIGSRVLKPNKGLTTVQKFGNSLACVLMKWFFKYHYSDLGPFRAIKREKLFELEMQDKNFGWTVEMQIKAAKMGYNIIEVPVSYRERYAGKSKVSGTIKGVFQAGFKILSLIFKYKFINKKDQKWYIL